MVESTANDDWENIRGPRPWEDNSEYLRAKFFLILNNLKK